MERTTIPDISLGHIGKRAGFETRSIRVPIGLVPFIDDLVKQYKRQGMEAANERLEQAAEALNGLKEAA